jgi:hypothetical protein
VVVVASQRSSLYALRVSSEPISDLARTLEEFAAGLAALLKKLRKLGRG